jgi:hypothetical protein
MEAEKHSYFESRAAAELSMAETASHPAAAKAHSELAALYLDRVHGNRKAASNDPAVCAPEGRRASFGRSGLR